MGSGPQRWAGLAARRSRPRPRDGPPDFRPGISARGLSAPILTLDGGLEAPGTPSTEPTKSRGRRSGQSAIRARAGCAGSARMRIGSRSCRGRTLSAATGPFDLVDPSLEGRLNGSRGEWVPARSRPARSISRAWRSPPLHRPVGTSCRSWARPRPCGRRRS